MIRHRIEMKTPDPPATVSAEALRSIYAGVRKCRAEHRNLGELDRCTYGLEMWGEVGHATACRQPAPEHARSGDATESGVAAVQRLQLVRSRVCGNGAGAGTWNARACVERLGADRPTKSPVHSNVAVRVGHTNASWLDQRKRVGGREVDRVADDHSPVGIAKV
jgi:hypothetical protein